MRFLLPLAVLVCRWLTVDGIGRCPFPGITAHAKFKNSSINWQNRTSFQEGDVVGYFCLVLSWNNVGVQYLLTCRNDGTWDQPLPRCGNEFIYFDS